MKHKHEALWFSKKIKLYTLFTLILFNLHLTIGSKSRLIQNELWVPKCYQTNSNLFLLVFFIVKKCNQDFNQCVPQYLLYIFILMKSDSYLVCFHFKMKYLILIIILKFVGDLILHKNAKERQINDKPIHRCLFYETNY